ncbi:hypothetical protein OSTOST_06900 [Ostertagia ostertagi]
MAEKTTYSTSSHSAKGRMKKIYRSLAIATLMALFGWFTTAVVGTLAQMRLLDISELNGQLLSGNHQTI